MDIADKAAQREAEFLAESLARHEQKQHNTDTGRTHCEDCGEPIPAARRAAVPGARLCVGCQAYAEYGWP